MSPRLSNIVDTRIGSSAATCTQGVPGEEFRRAVDCAEEAALILLRNHFAPEQVATLFGKVIDQAVIRQEDGKEYARALKAAKDDPVKRLRLTTMRKARKR